MEKNESAEATSWYEFEAKSYRRGYFMAAVLGFLVASLVFAIARNPADVAKEARPVWDWLALHAYIIGQIALAIFAGLLSAAAVVQAIKAAFGHHLPIRRKRSWPLFPTVAAAVALGLLLVWAGYVLIGHTLHPAADAPPTRIDVLKTALTGVAGVGGAVALVVAYRRQRDLEQGRFVERFGAAAAQLGDPDPAVRIAGVYAMASTADEATQVGRRQQCVDVLCGYLRLPYDPDTGASDITELVTKAGPPPSQTDQGPDVTTHRKIRQNDQVVRTTIISVIRDHLKRSAEISWSKCDFDFDGAVFQSANFDECRFEGTATFNRARFLGLSYFDSVRFEGMTGFVEAHFEGEVNFTEATFQYLTIFTRATFAAPVTFFDARFTKHVEFTDCIFVDQTVFSRATFAGGTEFERTGFIGKTAFKDTKFTGKTDFKGAIFAGDIFFVGNYFAKGSTSFRESEFQGQNVVFWSPRSWNKDHVFFDWDSDGTTIPAGVFPQPPTWPPTAQGSRA